MFFYKVFFSLLTLILCIAPSYSLAASTIQTEPKLSVRASSPTEVILSLQSKLSLKRGKLIAVGRQVQGEKKWLVIKTKCNTSHIKKWRYVDRAGLLPDTSYNYKVNINKVWTKIVRVKTPASNNPKTPTITPTGTPTTRINLRIAAETISDGKILISWKLDFDSGALVLERKVGDGSFVSVSNVSGPNEKYLDSSVGAGATFTYRIVDKTSGETSNEVSASPNVIVPVEVFQEPVSVAFYFDEKPTDISALQFKVHGQEYENALTVQLNNGQPVNVNNSTVSVLGNPKLYGGIGSPLGTLSFTMQPPGEIVQGQNIITFRFNDLPDNHRLSQLRVLDIQLLNINGENVLPVRALKQEDPSTWTSPLPDSDSIAKGKELWSGASLIRSFRDHTALQAKCSDCHYKDGADLKYFNYSNGSIINRSMYHGLTLEQGEQIASYIRSLSVTKAEKARPWNPPYQPGPGIDSRPVGEWAAGAGLESVLEKDSDMLPYLFPAGSTWNTDKLAVAGNSQLNASGTLNVRELPIDMQLLDWNHWLPELHWKDSDLIRSSVSAINMDKLYSDIESKLLAKGVDNYVCKPMSNSYFYTVGSMPWDISQAGSRVQTVAWDIMDSTKTPPGTLHWTLERQRALRSLVDLRLVRETELMNKLNGTPQECGRKVFPRSGSEDRSGFTSSFFMASPFMTKIPTSTNGGEFSKLYEDYISSAWYQQQLVYYNGNKFPRGTGPLDIGYMVGFFYHLGAQSGNHEPLRFLAFFFKVLQQTNNGVGPEVSISGYHPNAPDLTALEDPTLKRMFKALPDETIKAIKYAFVRQWLNVASTFSLTQWRSIIFPDPDFVPTPTFNSANFADTYAAAIPLFCSDFGSQDPVCIELKTWQNLIWPKAT